MGNKSSSGSRMHPYMKDGFWDKASNQFWEKSDLFNKEKYREQFKIINYEKDKPAKHSE